MLSPSWAYGGPSWAYVGSSWGPLLDHLRAHFAQFMLTRAHRPKLPIMRVRAARIADTTLVKPTVFAFRHHEKTCDFPRAQSPVKHNVFPESACEGFFVKKHLQNYICQHSHLYLCSSSHLHSHLHIYISAHLHILTSTSHLHSHVYLCSSSHLHSHLRIFIFTHLHLCSCSHLHIYISAHLHILTSTSHIFTSRSSLLPLLRPGAVPPEHACRGREMQARVRFGFGTGNPLQRSRVSRARNAGESAF